MICGLVGENVSQSYSKIIHNALFPYEYRLHSVESDRFEEFLRRADFRGMNVTMPYKRRAAKFCDVLSDGAAATGCVNTIVREKDGTHRGYNTDIYGFLRMAKRAGISLRGKKVLILGGGGTSSTARYCAKAEGAGEIVVVERSGDVTYSDLSKHADSEIIINTTPVGMFPKNGEKLVSLSSFPKCRGVLDVVYNPIKSALVLEAETRAVPTSGGLPMLVYQAKAAGELFLSEKCPDTAAEKALDLTVKKVMNIALIGMPGCGKSSVGRIIAERLSRKFLDTDDIVEKIAGIAVPDIFQVMGETSFRDLESAAVFECGALSGRVIATGGGAILKKENRAALSQNSRIYFINRDVEKLSLDGRPLSKDADAVKRLFNERINIYSSFSDVEINGNGSADETASRIIADFKANAGI